MWLPLSDLRLFGESQAADELLSSETAVQKKFRQKGPGKIKAEYRKLVSADRGQEPGDYDQLGWLTRGSGWSCVA